jgi:hypothetical protein
MLATAGLECVARGCGHRRAAVREVSPARPYAFELDRRSRGGGRWDGFGPDMAG